MNFTIYILAEGHSSRMGQDKGLVKINGLEMVAHCIKYLKPLEKEIVIITSNPAYKKFDCRIIADEVKNIGPAQGIITALEDSSTEKNLIVSCDMPLVNDLMIRQFDDLMMVHDIVCFYNQFLYPFPGLYSKSILPSWRELLAKGEHKMQYLIKQFDYKTLPIEQADLFLNVNTPQDIKTAEAKLKQ